MRNYLLTVPLSLLIFGIKAEPSVGIPLEKVKNGNLYLTVNAYLQNHNTQLTSMNIPVTAQAFAQSISEQAKDMGSWITRNKKKSVVMLIGSIYGSLVSTLAYARVKLKTHKWANWHNRSSLKELLSYPQEQLAQELLYDIQHIYRNPNNPTDVVYPLSQFFVKSAKEKASLDFFSMVVDVIRITRLTRFFPLFHKVANEVREQQERLNHYINLVQTWTDREKMSKLNVMSKQVRSIVGDKNHQEKTLKEYKKFFDRLCLKRKLIGMNEACANALVKWSIYKHIPFSKRYIAWSHNKSQELEKVNELFTYDFMEHPEGIHLRYDDDPLCCGFMCADLNEHEVIIRRLKENEHKPHHVKSVA